MQYLLLIYEDEKIWTSYSKEQAGQVAMAYTEYTTAIKNSGHFRAGDALQPTTTATTVRLKGGKTLTTDGPFAETKEQLGGFYIVEAKDLDEAVALAARIPAAKTGSIEVRPIMVFS